MYLQTVYMYMSLHVYKVGVWLHVCVQCADISGAGGPPTQTEGLQGPREGELAWNTSKLNSTNNCNSDTRHSPYMAKSWHAYMYLSALVLILTFWRRFRVYLFMDKTESWCCPIIVYVQGLQKTSSLTHLSFKGSSIGDRATEGTWTGNYTCTS